MAISPEKRRLQTIPRRQFIKFCSFLGIASSTALTTASCDIFSPSTKTLDVSNFKGKVIIIGAGAAGMAAGHLLSQQGIDFQIIEASSSHGGRMKRDATFADFPLPLGAEWLHATESEFSKIVNDDSVKINIKTQPYNSQDKVEFYEDGRLFVENLGRDRDKKFIDSSWLDFYEQYIVPGIIDQIVFDTEIISINYQDPKVILKDSTGNKYTADKVIFTAPLLVLKDKKITFIPELPSNKQNVIASAQIWIGIKVFFEFGEKFYPTFLSFPDSETLEGQRLYYDAAYGQNTEKNILGLFAVGKQAQAYISKSGEKLKDFILAELDEIYDGIPSKAYINHIEQNWVNEAFINMAYLSDFAPEKISSILAESIQNKVFFAGEAYTKEDDWGAVHNAARAARDAVHELLSTTSI
ncbi:amine oxidase [[Leptolyngbya] sp. PCC 7376]|uniref:flavin monoamine oxidase family protein n=1 Tax=[Leptolyngbya] sp. PCC 7376 TaxID=111781 RepID=UPI00029F45E4|nr:FAD-dependent oxidoreductase [[Leptolyngbya] sp. PCC 7376]AFY37030.1 amine oxidase [[Leptolyngbya] sp. PCC 7376]